MHRAITIHRGIFRRFILSQGGVGGAGCSSIGAGRVQINSITATAASCRGRRAISMTAGKAEEATAAKSTGSSLTPPPPPPPPPRPTPTTTPADSASLSTAAEPRAAKKPRARPLQRAKKEKAEKAERRRLAAERRLTSVPPTKELATPLVRRVSAASEIPNRKDLREGKSVRGQQGVIALPTSKATQESGEGSGGVEKGISSAEKALKTVQEAIIAGSASSTARLTYPFQNTSNPQQTPNTKTKKKRKNKKAKAREKARLEAEAADPNNMASTQAKGSAGPFLPYVNLINLRKLPYTCKALTRTQQLLISPFFDAVPFFTKAGDAKWDVREDTDVNGKPVLLIPLRQAHDFLDLVQRETGVSVPKHPMALYGYKEAQSAAGAKALPIKRGLIGTKDEWEELLEECKNRGLTTGASGGPKTAEEKAAKKVAAEQKAIRVRQSGLEQLKEAKELLGLGPEVEVAKDEVTASVVGVEVSDDSDGGVTLDAVDVTLTTTTTTTIAETVSENPNEIPALGAYFVCIDIESWERDHNLITEVGIATLDTTPFLKNYGQNTYSSILPHMTYRHIRISEHRNLRNGKYVNDNAKYFDFGETEFKAMATIPDTLAEAFTPPTAGTPVCFVAHDAPTDLKYLSKAFKFDAREKVDGLRVFDTAELYRAILGAKDTTALGKMLLALKLEPWHLHNAGNDAAFTLRSFVKMCGMEPVVEGAAVPTASS